MNESMINAMVSMNGLQQKLDIIADNIANANTAGYKRKQGSFEDLLTTLKQQPEAFSQPGRLTPLGFNQGWGTRLTIGQPDLSQGPLQKTDQPYDVAIQGDAMFEVAVDNAGDRGYTRSGAFQLAFDSNGLNILTTKDGYPVLTADGQRIEIPPEVQSLRVGNDGAVQGILADDSSLDLGRLSLVQAVKPEFLLPVADNLFTVPDGINTADVIRTVTAAAGSDISLQQGYLEQSNVNLTQEMTDLINVQRAYQLSARALSSSDTMFGLANNMRG